MWKEMDFVIQILGVTILLIMNYRRSINRVHKVICCIFQLYYRTILIQNYINFFR